MKEHVSPLKSFVSGESGAVTTDWVVLTAALVGLGLAVMGVLTDGVEESTDDIDASLRGVQITTAFEYVYDSYDFSNGRGDWVGGEIMNINGFGDMLVLSGDADTADLPIDIDDSYGYAVVEFDLIMGDSWDGESGFVTLNGESFELTTNHRSNNPTVTIEDGPGDTTVTLVRQTSGTGNTSTGWSNVDVDHTYAVRVVTANDGSGLELGASTTLQQDASDEFMGIDNVRITGTNDG